VRVSAPHRLSDAQIQQSIESRVGWIQTARTRARARANQSAQANDTLDHLRLFGGVLPVNVTYSSGRSGVSETKRTIQLRSRPGESREQQFARLLAWRRAQLGKRIAELVAKWQPILNVTVAEWRVRRMRTRWGTCNISARRIWLNVALAQFPVECLEYVVVHEMVHLLERGHNRRFYALLDEFLPDWRTARASLRACSADQLACD
jgi:predicted metal-dependent hydrolase